MSHNDALTLVHAMIRKVTAAWASGQSLEDIRAGFEQFLEEAGGSHPAKVTTRDMMIGSMPARWFIPQSESGETAPCLLYCHGGGYQIGSIRSHASLMGRLAERCNMRVLGFEYRLAPEHRFPAALDDAVAAYQWLLQQGEAPLALIGDSAGGGLALATSIRARDQGLPLPRALVLLSAWLDLSLSGASYQTLEAVDVFSKPGQLKAMARTYKGRGADMTDPEASPVFADLKSLPPMLVLAGGHDITLDDSRLLKERATAAGVDCELRIFPEMVHHFQVFADLPQTTDSFNDIAAFLKTALQSSVTQI
jgi:monoterpene epsilon-lactone hydrolase